MTFNAHNFHIFIDNGTQFLSMILFIIELLRLDGSRRRLILCVQTEHSMFVQPDLSGIESTSKSISRIECDRTLAIDKDLHH